MGWWGNGLVDSSCNEPIESEVGDFVEEKILGGICMAVWEENHIGDFKRALSMGIEVNGNFFKIGSLNLKTMIFMSLIMRVRSGKNYLVRSHNISSALRREI